MLDEKVRIVKTKETPTFDDASNAVLMLRTTWYYGKRHGPYTDDAPKEGWTVQAFNDRIAPIVRELAQLPE